MTTSIIKQDMKHVKWPDTPQHRACCLESHTESAKKLHLSAPTSVYIALHFVRYTMKGGFADSLVFRICVVLTD